MARILFLFLFISMFAGAAEYTAPFSPWKASLAFPPAGSAFDMKHLNNYDIDSNGFVTIRDGRFYTKGGRLRFCGQNLAFNAMFPPHALAEQMAEHLARQGVNALRVVSIDNISGTPGYNIWGKYAATQEQFDPDQMEKLDYFFWQLKQRGIYLCFDLHFNRVYPDTPKYSWKTLWPKGTYCKGIDNFIPELIDLQKKFTTDFFAHVNPYTKLAYRDDPQFALIEINNENAFYREMISSRKLPELPEVFSSILKNRWNDFLLKKYASFPALAASWGNDRASGAHAAIDGIMPLTKDNKWQAEITDPSKGVITFADDVIDLTLATQEKKGFFNVLKTGLAFEKGKAYTLTVTLKAKKGAVFSVNAMRMGPPWGYIGLVAKIKVDSSEMKPYKAGFVATVDTKTAEPNYGRITIRDFEGSDRFVISSVTVEEGAYAVDALGAATAFGSIALPDTGNLTSYPAAAQKDFMEFIHALEKDYWVTMRDHAKNAAGIRAPVTGTQIDYTFADMAEVYDYVDFHAYWQHPAFPGGGWDGKNYYVGNTSMLPPSDGNTLMKMMPYRVKGKPFVVSEYDHPFANDYAGESAPFMALMQNLHDLDGVFFFCFLSTLDNLNSIGYFSYFNNFIKSHTMPFTAYLIRGGTVPPFANEVSLGMTHDALLGASVLNPGSPNIYYRTLPLAAFTGGRFSLALGAAPAEVSAAAQSLSTVPDKRLVWTQVSNNVKDNYLSFNDRNAKLYAGWTTAENRYRLGNVTLSDVTSLNGYFLFTVFSKDGSVGGRGTHIVTLASKNRYSGLDYLNYDTKTPVGTGGDSHGIKMTTKNTASAQTEYIEGVTGEISLTLDAGVTAAAVTAIANGGGRLEIPARRDGQTVSFTADPKYGTLVYIIEAH
ncbi:MAG: hypothetical protein HZC28_13565 [Spirochaetes bacterium]|nr:hypothetical protein [Spirochaetota bacterium]